MTRLRQGWLVARREVRERSRSKGLWVGMVLMLVVVVAAIVVPALADGGLKERDVGVAGDVPAGLAAAVERQGEAVEVRVDVTRYDDVADGERAVREGDVDVLVVDARRLEWRARVDEPLRAVVTGAIQLVEVQIRAAAAGIDAEQLAALAAPVAVENVELGIARDRSPEDEAAASTMALLLLAAIATYGQLVLTGVVQEKASRVVEVLLARVAARTLLVGKVAGIGLVGFLQFAVTALAALVATLTVDSVDLPAVSTDVLAWAVAWFVLGYAFYAMAYGALGSLASRVEDASSIAAPVTTVLLVGYWGAFVAVSEDPEGSWSRLVGLFPATAPFAMPARIALGVAGSWEPAVAVLLMLGAIVALSAFAGRVYAGAILHGGSRLKLREAWHPEPHRRAAGRRPAERRPPAGRTARRRGVARGRGAHG